jgi:peroxiredoxin Q/BCP
MSEMPAVGATAPEFNALDQSGTPVQPGDLRGKWVVLYFYPKDDTPGCTKEACNFRDNHAALRAAGATVIGVSGDSQAAHARFAAKYDLPFTLLVDGDHIIAKAYGAWGIKKQYGREYEGVIRSTFVIDPGGNVAKVWPRVKPDTHGAEVLAWIESNATA